MAQHKYAQAGLVARTGASAADVIRMAEACASSQESDFFRGLGPVQVLTRSAAGAELAVMGGLGNKYKQLTFTLTTSTDGDDDVAVRTRITWYRTQQSTVMGFIPIGPKTMLGYKAYSLFLDRLASTMREADSSARIQISAAADSVAVGS